MNRTSDTRELNVEEVDLVSGGAHASVNIGPLHIDASTHGFGISIGGEVGISFGSGGAYGYIGGCSASTNSHGTKAGCTPA